MRCKVPVSRRVAFACGVVLALAAGPGTLAAAEERVEQQDKTGRGKFNSYKEGVVTLKGNSGATLVWSKLPENAKAIQYNPDEKAFKPVGGLAALSGVKPGTWIQVIIDKENATIRIGERKGQTTGTFVSYKNDRLLILGKDLGPSYVKKYGNNVHFNKFADDVPVYESIDGGEFQLAGTPGTVLPNVKEGTILTVHGEGDDNITLIQIGVPAKK